MALVLAAVRMQAAASIQAVFVDASYDPEVQRDEVDSQDSQGADLGAFVGDISGGVCA